MAYADDLAKIQRRRQMAQALIQQGAQPQGVQAGRIFVGPSPVSSLASLAGIVAGGVMDRKARKQEDTLTEQRRKQLSDMLAGIGGSQAMPSAPMNGTSAQRPGMVAEQGVAAGARGPMHQTATPSVDPQRQQLMAFLQGLPVEQQEAIVGQQAMAKLFPKAPEEYTLKPGESRFQGGKQISSVAPERRTRTINLGGQMVTIDEATGLPVADALEVTNSPDALLSADTTRRGQDIGASTSMRGQDITMRGQDMTSQTAAEKLAAESAERQAKTDSRNRGEAARAERVISTVDEAINLASGWSTGAAGELMRRYAPGGGAGTDALALSKAIDTVKANLSFAELQRMRSESPTGGALGSITERELDLLGSTIANLDPAQDDETLKANLEKVREHYSNWLELTQLGSQSASSTGASPSDSSGLDAAMARYLNGGG